MTSRDARRTRLLLASLAVLTAWAAVAFVVGPLLIRQGYAGRSFAWINGVFDGRSTHSIERYLTAWRELSYVALAGLGAVFASTVAYRRYRASCSRIIDAVVGGPETISTVAWLRLTLAAGLVGGALQAAYLAARQAIMTQPGSFYLSETWWMAPLSAAVASVLAGTGIALLAHLGSGRIGLWKAGFVLGFLCAFGVIQSDGIALYPITEYLLALGLAAVAARILAGNASAMRRGLDRATPALVVVLIGLLFVAWRDLPRVQERAAAAGLVEPMEGLPNLLIVILDTTRARQLGSYGYHRATSDNLDEWAARGVTFDWAFSASSWTLPSHATMFTGLPNAVLGTSINRPLEDRFITLAEVLSDLGYATGGFVANRAYTTETSGLQQGFQRYEDRPYGAAAFLRSSWIADRLLADPLSRTLRISLPRIWSKTAEDVRIEFVEWLRRDREPDRPFFAFLNLFDAHEPYDPPGSWPSHFGPAGEGPFYDFYREYRPQGGEPKSAEEVQPWINRYDGAIAYIDSQLGILRDTLRAEGLLDNTVVVITSDHGEMWGEKQEIGHAASLYSPAVHVPLFIIAPGRLPEARRVQSSVSLVDLAATLGGVMDLEALREMPGRSFADLGDASDTVEPAMPILALEPQGSAAQWWAPSQGGSIRSIVDGPLQFIVNGDGREELYHLEDDPELMRDLANHPAWQNKLEELRSELRLRLEQAATLRARGPAEPSF